jgi:uncharacterized protein YjiS (DUF1127 family)
VADSSFRVIAAKEDARKPQRRVAAGDVAQRRRSGRLARWAKLLIAWYQGFADRRLLASLDDRQLRDLGIDRSTVGGDSTSAYWRLRESPRIDSGQEGRRGRGRG